MDKKILLLEEGYHEFPAPTPRWSKMSGRNLGEWSRTPGPAGCEDPQQATEFTLKACAKAIDPPLMVRHDGIYGGVIRTNPSGITYVKSNETGNPSMAPIPLGTRWDVVKLEIEDLKQAIRESFFVDQLSLKESPQMTAEEVRARIEQMQKMLGPTLGRIESEFLNPLIQRVFNIMFRAKALNPPPRWSRKPWPPRPATSTSCSPGRWRRISGSVRCTRSSRPTRSRPRSPPRARPCRAWTMFWMRMSCYGARRSTLGVVEEGIRDPKVVAELRKDRADAEAKAAATEKNRIDAGTAKDLSTAAATAPGVATGPRCRIWRGCWRPVMRKRPGVWIDR